MLAQKVLPLLWLRFAVVIGFGIYVATEQMWLISAISAGLAILTGLQIRSAYKSYDSQPAENH